MLEEILKVVKEKLPSIQADALSEFFAEAKETKRRLGLCQQEHDRLLKQINELTKSNADITGRLRNIEARETTVGSREAIMDELDFKYRLGEEQVKHADEKQCLLRSILCDVFRNPTVRKTVIENGVAVTKHDSGCGSLPDQTPVRTERETTETQE